MGPARHTHGLFPLLLRISAAIRITSLEPRWITPDIRPCQHTIRPSTSLSAQDRRRALTYSRPTPTRPLKMGDLRA